jgi:RHS repeat-associated protein
VCSFGVGPGSTPVFGQSFPDILFNPSPSDVPHNISSVNNQTRPFTDVTTDVNGNYNGTIVAQGNGFQAGAAGTPLQNFFAAFTGSFVVSQPGDLTFRILHDDGYVFGVGGFATRVSGDLTNDPAATAFNNYPVMAAQNISSNGATSTGADTVHFPAAGTYPFEIDYTECNSGSLFLVLLTEKFIAQTEPLSLYVGYADGLRGGSVFPFPWQGSPGVSFIGGCTFDAGALRFDNAGDTDITLDKVTVDLGAGGPHFGDIWNTVTTPPFIVPAHGILILTQTGCYNFDTSDFSNAGCGTSNGVLPLVNVTRGGVTKTYTDTNQILNTHGFDVALCTGNESISWQRIAGSAAAVDIPLPPAVTLNLTPFNVPGAAQGQNLALTVSAMDGGGNPQVSLPVSLQITGANTQTLTATTGVTGLATFNYTGLVTGTDTVQASAFIMGLRSVSNLGTVVWNATPGGGGALAPSITGASPADGSVVTKPVAVNATIAPPSGHSITGWRVFYQSASGGPLVVIGSGTGAPPSPLGVTFDPTVLTNGAYTLTVEATADNGAVQDVNSGIAVVGDLKLGRYKTTFSDMTVPVNGFQMQVLRTYDSTDVSTGDFGIGWRVDVSNFRISANRMLGAGGWTQYDKSCVLGLCFTGFQNPAPRFVTVVYPNQRTEIFDFVPDGGTNIFWSCSPVFKARASAGSTSTLVALDDTSCSYNGDGNLYGKSGAYNPQKFQLTTRSGQVFVLDHSLGLVSVTDRNGNRLNVDGSGIHSSSGQSIIYTRDGTGRITTIVGPSGQTLHYTYSAAGDLASSVSPNGATTTYTYDASHHLLGTTGPGGPLQTQHYDGSGRLTSITDGAGHTVQISSNVAGQQETIIDRLGKLTTVMTYNDVGDPVRIDKVADGTTLTSTMTYDAAGDFLTITDAAGGTTSATYDAGFRMTSRTDPAGNTSHYAYDSLGDVTSVTGPGGVVLVTMTFDPSGNLLTISDGAGGTNTFVYDSNGRVATRTDPSGRSVSFTYTSGGTVASTTSAAGTSTYTSDASGRITSVTDANGHSVTLTFDADGNLLSQTAANGTTRSWTYDGLDRLLTATNPNGGHSTLTYDAVGRVVAVTDANGATVARTFDADDRLLSASAADGSSATFAYDGFGRMVSAVTPAASLGFTYDSRNYLLSQTTGGAQPANTLSFTYDANGRRTSSTGPDGTTAYAYSALSGLVSVTDSGGGIFKYSYDAALHMTSLQRPDGVVDTNTYDPSGNLLSRVSATGGTTISSEAYTYSASGGRTSQTDQANQATYQFDPVAQLMSVTNTAASIPNESYSYDAAGNRTLAGSTAISYDSGGRMVMYGGTTYAYDAQGQRTSATDAVGNVTTYSWNAFHQLAGVTLGGSSTQYRYDALGRRVEVDQGTSAAHYTYDGHDLRLVYSGSALTTSYTTAPLIGTPLEMRQGSAVYYFLSDARGSTVGLADRSGALVASQRYDSFGNPVSSTGSVVNSLTYLGQQYDSGTGLYFLNARYYDPRTGTFLSQDPLPNLNAYAYAANNPVDLSDPSGASDLEEYSFLLKKDVVALNDVTAPQTEYVVEQTVTKTFATLIHTPPPVYAAAGDYGLALQFVLTFILASLPHLTFGLGVMVAIAILVLIAVIAFVICLSFADALPDPSSTGSGSAASGARSISAASGARTGPVHPCTGQPPGAP